MDQTIGFIFKAKDLASAVASKVANKLKGIGTELILIAKRGKAAQRSVSNFFSKAGRGAQRLTQSLTTVSIAIMGAHHTMMRMVDTVVGGMLRLAGSGVEAAAAVQESNMRLDFSLAKIGKNADVVKAKIDDLALRTVLTRREISDMVSGLAIQGVDAFDDSLNNLFVTMQDGSKQSITAMELMNDAVAFSGKTSRRVAFSVKEAVAERKIKVGRQLSEDLNLAGKVLDKWNAGLKRANSDQDAFNILMELMAERVGGATLALGGSLNFILKQIGDWRDKLGDMLFRDTLPTITNFIREAGDMFLQMVKDDSFATIRKSIGTTAEGLAMLAKIILVVVRGIAGLFEKVPALIPIITGLALMATAAAGFLLVLTGVMGPLLAFAGLAALLPTLLSAWLPILGAMILLVPLVIAVAAPFVALIALMGALIGLHVKFSNFTELWEKLKLIVAGVVEGITNLREGTTRFSSESAAAMEKAGILDTVIKIVTWFDRLVVIIDEAKVALKAMWPEFREALRPAMKEIINLANVLGIDLTAGLDTSMSTAKERGKALGEVISTVVRATIRLMTLMLQIAEKMAKVMGIDTTAGMGGSPESFNMLNQFQREEALKEGGRIPIHQGDSPGLFGMGTEFRSRKIEDIRLKDHADDPLLQSRINFILKQRKRRSVSNSALEQSLMDMLPETIGEKPHRSQDVTAAATGVAPPSAQNSSQPREVELGQKTIDMLARKQAIEQNRLLRSEPLETTMNPDDLASGVNESVNSSSAAGN